jgi:hypothetical protein
MYTLYNNNDNIYMDIGLPSRGSRAGDEHGGDGGQRRSHPARGTRSECAPEALLLLYICIQCIYIILYNIYMYIHLYMFTHTHTHTHTNTGTRCECEPEASVRWRLIWCRCLRERYPVLHPAWSRTGRCVCVCVCVYMDASIQYYTHVYIEAVWVRVMVS